MGYCLQDTVSWYQKKIGTYDKQPWEKTVEQHILNGFTPITKKTAKLKTQLIDIDLVRGSSFTKAKPKHGLMMVARLAFVRLMFLPMHWDWWVQQTSNCTFILLLLLYILQIVNMTLYFYFLSSPNDADVEAVSLSEVLVPLAMMFGLSTIHSHIVSPYSSSSQCSSNTKTRRAKRNKRRLCPNLRYRSSLGSDSKSSPDTGSELNVHLQGSKCRKRVRLRNTTPERPAAANSCKKPPTAAVGDLQPSNPSLSAEEAVAEGRPLQVDDGFESLNGNGSSDNNDDDTCNATGRDPYTQGCPGEAEETDHKDTDSEPSRPRSAASTQKLLNRRRGSLQALTMKQAESSFNSSGESDDGEMVTAEWIGVTTNSEECSYSSDLEDSVPAWDLQTSPAAILSPSCASSDKVSCTVWDQWEVKKAELSVLDISSAIIARVEGKPESLDYFYGGLVGCVLLAMVPSLCRLSNAVSDGISPNVTSLFSSDNISDSLVNLLSSAFGVTPWERAVILIAMLERLVLGGLFFFLLGIAERTYKQRFLYAKFFSHLTSFRRARKSELPHFRLNKVRNIKTWLSVRSYLKKRGPQRSVDTVVSAAFIATLLLLSFISVELLKDSVNLRSVYNIEALVWSLVLGMYLLRFMTLGSKITRKYRNLSVLITEQINLYLQIEQKPNKKEDLMVANCVLKLAADLLKELESPFKISLSANPYVYTITKVVILSALSGVLSEMLGFKLKLHKIKIK